MQEWSTESIMTTCLMQEEQGGEGLLVREADPLLDASMTQFQVECRHTTSWCLQEMQLQVHVDPPREPR